MSTDFDRYVEELEQQVIEQARAFYSDKVVEEFYHPKNLGRMPEPDARGLVHGWCGDAMEIYLRLKEERIEEVSFMTDGCGQCVPAFGLLYPRRRTHFDGDREQVPRLYSHPAATRPVCGNLWWPALSRRALPRTGARL